MTRRTLRTTNEAVAVAVAAVLTFGMFAIVYGLFHRPSHGIDDAEITMVYARNIAGGHGYVYSAGGERVEGSTSLLWTLLCSLIFWVTGGVHMSPLFAVSVLLTFAAVLGSLRLAWLCGGGIGAVICTAFLLAAAPAFFAWTTATLMDTALWTASLTVGLVQVADEKHRRTVVTNALVCAGLVLSRPEGIVVGPAMAALQWASCVLDGAPEHGSRRAAFLPMVVTAGSIAATFIFRLSYFGYPFPNTFYAKVGGDGLYTAIEGARYVVRFLRGHPIHLLASCMAVWVLWKEGRKAIETRRVTLDRPTVARLAISAMLLVGLALPLLEGEDHFVGFRVMQPFVPIASVLAACALSDLLTSRLTWLRLLVVVGVVATAGNSWMRFLHDERPRFQHEFEQSTLGRTLALRVQEHLAPGVAPPNIGAATAGGIALEYSGRVQDLLGLNWVAMAHASRDRRGVAGHASFSNGVFWSDPPMLLGLRILPLVPTTPCDVYFWWEDGLFHGLFHSEQFLRSYRAIDIAVPEGDLVGYARADWLAGHPLRGVNDLGVCHLD